jgi:VanZ family protein
VSSLDPTRPGATRLSLWLPVALNAALIFGLSSIHRLPMPPGPNGDKWAHALMYGCFCTLVMRALASARWTGVTIGAAVGAAGLTVLYGATDELHQHFVPGRSMDAADLVADAIGALLAASLLFAWAIIRRRGAPTA